MSRRVAEYPLRIATRFEVELPIGATARGVHAWHDKAWSPTGEEWFSRIVLLASSFDRPVGEPLERRIFGVFTSGADLPNEEGETLAYVGTFVLDMQTSVLGHLFEYVLQKGIRPLVGEPDGGP